MAPEERPTARFARRAGWFSIPALLSSLAYCAVANGQAVQWFPPDGTSFIRSAASSRTVHGSEPDRSCVIAMPNVLLDQHPEDCTPHSMDTERPRFVANPSAKTESKSSVRDAAMEVVALQNAVFTGNSLQVAASAETVFQESGEMHAVHRGVGRSNGHVFFRIPKGGDMTFRVTADMRWTSGVLGNRGGFQMHGKPNSGGAMSTAVTSGAFDHSGSEGHLERSGRLKPGVYWISWHTESDELSGNSRVSLDLDLRFEPDCTDAVQPEASPGYCPLVPGDTTRAVDINRIYKDTSWLSWLPRALPDLHDVADEMDAYDLRALGLPVPSCVIAAHGNPDMTLTMDWFLQIKGKCKDDEPVVLLSCNTGRIGAGVPFGQRLANLLKRGERSNTVVYAPNWRLSAGSDRSSFELDPDHPSKKTDLALGYMPITTPDFVKFCGRDTSP